MAVLARSRLPSGFAIRKVIGQKRGKSQPQPRPVSPGRPRREVDLALLRELRGKGYGYKRIAKEYTREAGDNVSHPTVRDRLFDV